MANGLSRVQKYARLDVDDHLTMVDNDLDLHDIRFDRMHEAINQRFDAMEADLKRVFWTGVSLLIAVIGALITVAVFVGR